MKEIIIDGVKYEITPKTILTDEEFINYVLEKNKVDFKVGDFVWFKGEDTRKQCGSQKFKVLSFKPVIICNGRVENYLCVNLENPNGGKTSYLTNHLEKYPGNTIKEITIDDVKYKVSVINYKNENNSHTCCLEKIKDSLEEIIIDDVKYQLTPKL